jgi:hypothetical protein
LTRNGTTVLQQERGEIIAEHFVAKREAPTFKQVAEEELLLLPPSLEEGSLPCLIRPLSSIVNRCVLVSAGRLQWGRPDVSPLTLLTAQTLPYTVWTS